MLVDGKMEASERRFLEQLGTELHLARETVLRILEVMLIKNSA